jgi:hypothetical protein
MSIRDSGIVSGPAAHRGGVIVDPVCVKELRRVAPRYATIEEATTGIKKSHLRTWGGHENGRSNVYLTNPL